jgi:hypothetical protein
MKVDAWLTCGGTDSLISELWISMVLTIDFYMKLPPPPKVFVGFCLLNPVKYLLFN